MLRNILTNLMFIAFCFSLYGCYNYQQREQEDWHKRINEGRSAVVLTARQGPPLLVERQVLALIRREPDFQISTLQFPGLFAEDDPDREWSMSLIWKGYYQTKRRVADLHCVQEPDRWQDCEEFKQCTLWVYDESRHFSKPLHHRDWLYCFFCAKPGFLTVLFFVEDGEVFGTISINHDRPLRSVPATPSVEE